MGHTAPLTLAGLIAFNMVPDRKDHFIFGATEDFLVGLLTVALGDQRSEPEASQHLFQQVFAFVGLEAGGLHT